MSNESRITTPSLKRVWLRETSENSSGLFHCTLTPDVVTSRQPLSTVPVLVDFERVDLAGIKFTDFAITCSIYSKMCY